MGKMMRVDRSQEGQDMSQMPSADRFESCRSDENFLPFASHPSDREVSERYLYFEWLYVGGLMPRTATIDLFEYPLNGLPCCKRMWIMVLLLDRPMIWYLESRSMSDVRSQVIDGSLAHCRPHVHL